MSNQYGPWATSIEAGGNPQLSTFWRKRLTLLVPTSQTNPTLSRRNLLYLGVTATTIALLPTLQPAVADDEKPANDPTATKRTVAATAGDTKTQTEMLDEFNRLYALKDGQVWKHIAPPFSPGRRLQWRNTYPNGIQSAPSSLQDGPDQRMFLWRSGKLENWGSGGRGNLFDPLRTLAGIYPEEIEGDRDVLISEQLRADWIYREGASRKDTVAQLERILNDDCKLPVQLSLRDVQRKVFVAKGEFKLHPVPVYSGGRNIFLYDKSVPKDYGNGGATAKFDELLKSLGMFLRVRIVNDVKNPPQGDLSWLYDNVQPNPLADKVKDRNVANVLKHVTEQTDITFTEETRTVSVLFVERAK